MLLAALDLSAATCKAAVMGLLAGIACSVICARIPVRSHLCAAFPNAERLSLNESICSVTLEKYTRRRDRSSVSCVRTAVAVKST